MFIISPILRLAGKIASYVLYLLTLASAYGGYCNPEYFALPSVITLLLPWLGIATFIVTAIWLISRRWIVAIFGVVTLVASWSTLSDAVPLGTPKALPDGAETFSLLTFNCLHLNDIKNPGKMDDNRAVRFIINSGADVVCLQELRDIANPVEVANLPESLRDSLFAIYPYQAGNRLMDLKVLSKYPVDYIPFATNGRNISNYETRFGRFILKIKGHKVNLINMHLTSYNLSEKERDVVSDMAHKGGLRKSYAEFTGSILEKLKESFRRRSYNIDNIIELTRGSSAPTIVCGDFNDVPGSWAYRKMRQAGFNDAVTETVFGPRHTYNQHFFLFRIDQIFYRGPLEALGVKRETIDTSDHYPLLAEFAFLPSEEEDF